MAKLFYTDYVRHCLRFYISHRQMTEFKTPADEANWKAVDGVFKALPAEQQKIVEDIYSCKDNFALAVSVTAIKHGKSEDEVRIITRQVEKQIATARSL